MTLDEMLENASTLQQSGAVEAAERAYLLAISHFPDSAEARYRRGLLHLAESRAATAAILFRQALALAPSPRFYLSLGAALELDGRAQAAAAAYRVAITAAPDLVEAKFGLGRCQQMMGQIEAAIVTYQDVLAARPDSSAVWFNLGMALYALHRPADAARAFRAAVTSAPDNAEAWVNLAFMLERADQPEAALAACEEARAAGVNRPTLLVNQASALRALGRFEAALAVCSEALREAPGEAAAYATLTATLSDMGHHDRAIAAADLALEHHPDPAPADRAGLARIVGNKGLALLYLGRLEEAIVTLREAVAANPADADIAVNLGLALLSSGTHMREGFALFERRREQGATAPRGFSEAFWQGEDIAGRTILLHAEEGFGDTLQFVRYAPLVAARGARVILEVPPPLVRLCAGLPGVTQVVATGAALPAFDCHCPLLSLPHVFGTTLETIPAAIPYLAADPALVREWATRLPPGPGLRVGLVWAGHAQAQRAYAHRVDPRRSLALAALAPLGAVPGIAFVSLQKGPPANELAHPPFTINDPMAEVRDFADTAALIAGLDLVISVDTAVAHLAGALGKPVWMLSRFDACWRWLRARSDSPWYPTLRVYRQPSPGEWAPAIATLTADLARLARQSADATARAA